MLAISLGAKVLGDQRESQSAQQSRSDRVVGRFDTLIEVRPLTEFCVSRVVRFFRCCVIRHKPTPNAMSALHPEARRDRSDGVVSWCASTDRRGRGPRGCRHCWWICSPALCQVALCGRFGACWCAMASKPPIISRATYRRCARLWGPYPTFWSAFARSIAKRSADKANSKHLSSLHADTSPRRGWGR